MRLTSGLVLFFYATTHLLNHAFGIRSLEAMQAAGIFLLKPWQSLGGHLILYSAFALHGSLGLYAFYRRRHFRIPPNEIWQVALGLTIPLLLIPHAVVIAAGKSVYGLEFGYPRVVYDMWEIAPQVSLPRQYLLLLVVWIHGCIGIRAWLRSKDWYPHLAAPLASLATLVPVLALIGFTNGGLEIRSAAKKNRTPVGNYLVAPPTTEASQRYDSLLRVTDSVSFFYLTLLAGTAAVRALRDWHARRFRSIGITYPGGRIATVPLGFSLLEASRWAGIPHASVCGGRGRCSTCRVSVSAGLEELPPANAVERKTLAQINAAPSIRLACQLRPVSDISITPLVKAQEDLPRSATRFDAAVSGGSELEVAALFVDLRQSTRLATNRLPYDALYLFDRYIQLVTAAISENVGVVTSVAGDGVMSVFGVDGKTEDAPRNAWNAALKIWSDLDLLNAELGSEIESPLRIGMGLHVGEAVIAWMSTNGAGSLQFLGDTGNIAAKLEAEANRRNCPLVMSLAALGRTGLVVEGAESDQAHIPGRAETIEIAVFRQRPSSVPAVAAQSPGGC